MYNNKKASKIKPVVLNIIGGGIFSEKLINLARNNGAYVNDYGYVFEDTLKANILNNSHFGLNLYHSHNIGLTIKSIDYFSAGLPIINSIKGDTWDFVEKYNLGKILMVRKFAMIFLFMIIIGKIFMNFI